MCGGLLCEVFLVGAVYGGLDMGMEGWIWVCRCRLLGGESAGGGREEGRGEIPAPIALGL